MEYYSQYGQDTIIKQFFESKGVKNGTFLDVGSLDGVRFSNTLLLEQEGWNGVCIEAHPSYYELLKNNRPNSKCFSCAAGDEDKENAKISLNFRGSLTTLSFDLEDNFKVHYKEWYGDRDKKEINNFLNGHHEVKMRKIDTILSENGIDKLDLATIDIDGSEIYAFKGIELDKYNITLLILEHSVLGHDYMNQYAQKNGYSFAVTIGSDNFYVKTESDINILKNLKVYGNPKTIKHPVEL